MARKPGYFLLMMFSQTDGGIDIRGRLSLGNPRQNGEFYTGIISYPLSSASRYVPNSLFPEILNKVLKDDLRFSQIRIGKHRNKFTGVTTGGKSPDGAEMFVDEYAHTPDGLLSGLMAQRCDNGVQSLQCKDRNGVSFSQRSPFQLGMIQHFELSPGVEAR